MLKLICNQKLVNLFLVSLLLIHKRKRLRVLIVRNLSNLKIKKFSRFFKSNLEIKLKVKKKEIIKV